MQKKTESTLVIQPLPGIGDMVWFVPFLEALANQQQSGSITLLTKRRSLADQMFKHQPYVNDIIWVDRDKTHQGIRGLFKLAKIIKSYGFTKVYILHPSPRYALACWIAGIPQRLGYGLGWQRWLLNAGTYLPKHSVNFHPVDKAKLYLQLQQVPFLDDIPRLNPAQTDLEAVRKSFHIIDPPWIAIGVGCSEASRQWGIENFRLLCQRILAQYSINIFLVGGPSDESQILNLCQEHPQTIHPVISKPLFEVMAILASCQYFVGNDTGMLNLAAATGTRSIGIFGHSISSRLADANRNIYAIWPKNGLQGMDNISVDEVFEYVIDITSNHPQHRSLHHD